MRVTSTRARKCPLCGRNMQRHGRDKAGGQRWYCPDCGISCVGRRGREKTVILTRFLSWLLEEGCQKGQGIPSRTFRSRTAFCWRLQPFIIPDGKRHPVVMADGTYVGGHCLLICCDGITGSVLAWRWCGKENSCDYAALFDSITREYGKPLLLVSDGMRGIGKAAHTAWPGCRLQRCLVHVCRDCRTNLTLHPQTQPGRELGRVVSLLLQARNETSARSFLQALGEWYERWKTWLSEKSTYVSEATGELYKDWTHKRVRRCYTRLARLARNGQLFAFLDPDLAKACRVKHLPRNSNRLEGGINAPIKNMLRDHRGMPESHMLRACEWMCWKHSGRPLPSIGEMLKRGRPASPKGGEDYLPGWGMGVQWSDFHTETPWRNATD